LTTILLIFSNLQFIQALRYAQGDKQDFHFSPNLH
jgi:hypothetical protein